MRNPLFEPLREWVLKLVGNKAQTAPDVYPATSNPMVIAVASGGYERKLMRMLM